jgi:hypothetical protein
VTSPDSLFCVVPAGSATTLLAWSAIGVGIAGALLGLILLGLLRALAEVVAPRRFAAAITGSDPTSAGFWAALAAAVGGPPWRLAGRLRTGGTPVPRGRVTSSSRQRQRPSWKLSGCWSAALPPSHLRGSPVPPGHPLWLA